MDRMKHLDEKGEARRLDGALAKKQNRAEQEQLARGADAKRSA